MTKETDYRTNAAETLELAHRAANTEDKARLLGLAEAWLDLADRAHNAAARPIKRLWEHPLLRAKLGAPAEREAK